MQMQDMQRTGLFPEHEGKLSAPAIHSRVRLTISAREALLEHGAIVRWIESDRTYTVQLRDTVPPDLIVTRLANSDELGIRRNIEPEYPDEIGHAFWDQVDFAPCPICRAPLIWYEAGYVPGYRVCAKPPHHHIRVRD